MVHGVEEVSFDGNGEKNDWMERFGGIETSYGRDVATVKLESWGTVKAGSRRRLIHRYGSH